MKKNTQEKTALAAAAQEEEKKIDANTAGTHEDYDEMPYESHTYAFSSPVNLYTLAKLFKVNAPDFKTCKVLELGCASGGNILPYAINYPKAHFTGVDLSKRQVEEARKNVEALGIKNVALKHMSIMDIKKDFGKFDYIVAHGVYSWVPDEVQDKILQVCKDHLTDNGVAYISYNTLPGWNMIQTVRDMMIYHTAGFKTLAEKAQQGRLLLNFVKESFGKEGNSPYVKLIEAEEKILAGQGDYYLIHDHLNRDNHPCYFHEFMAKAAKHQLGYISDVDISQMYLGSLPENVRSVLATIQNDIVRTEQYIDFISNRRFRMSLLCKNDVKANRALNPEDVKNVYFRTKIEKKNEGSYQLTGLKQLTLSIANNPVGEALCEVLIEQQPNSTQVEELEQKVQKKLGAKVAKAGAKSIIYQNLLEIIIRGGGFISSDKDQHVKEISERPEVSKLARHQVSSQIWVTNQRYEKVTTDLFSRMAIKYCDGTKSIDEVKRAIISHVEKGDVNLNQGDKKIENKKDIEVLVGQLLKTALESLARNALLVA
jgi:methyltransferase-like protein/2-polyprenyl-3-methyl-5-hydroxy-6-metoxy-1,4-benzoquinol methylase